MWLVAPTLTSVCTCACAITCRQPIYLYKRRSSCQLESRVHSDAGLGARSHTCQATSGMHHHQIHDCVTAAMLVPVQEGTSLEPGKPVKGPPGTRSTSYTRSLGALVNLTCPAVSPHRPVPASSPGWVFSPHGTLPCQFG